METALRTNPFEHLRFVTDPPVAILPACRRAKSPVVSDTARDAEPALEPGMAALFSWLCDRAGVRMDDYRASVLQRRAGACLRAARCGSCAEALEAARRNPARAEAMLDALLVGVTSFFRDPLVFSALGRRWARMREDAAEGDRAWSVLSVGCSEGAELYSCAMLLDSLGLLDRARLLGTDCRPGAIRAARAGLYKPDTLADLGHEMVARHFEAHDGRVRVRGAVRKACAWCVRDAMEEHGTRSHDVILCRNLAIYLSARGADRLWAHLGGQLRPGGLLVVGRAERPSSDLFWKIGPCLYERKGVRS